ncbi:MAG: DNA translocase FtsK, partial [Oscillospiraceae bacterium]|nr:DNA translocase FtsK [Oscillospiraceae bacterium]
MATNSKSGGKSTASKSKSTSSKGKGGKHTASKASGAKQAAPAPAKPIRREVWALVCFFVGIFAAIGYFKVDAIFITYICGTIKGFIGYGYIILPPVLLICAGILAFHKGRPVKARSICLVLVPVVFGALCHLIFAKYEPDFSKFNEAFKTVYSEGMA